MTDSALIPVAVACPCPGTPHDGDTVYLRPKLDLRAGMVAQRKIIEIGSSTNDADEAMGDLAVIYCRHGVDSWTLVDEEGEALPVTPEAIENVLLADFSVGYPVADAAADLYNGVLLDPLVAKASKSSRPTRTRGSTSAPSSSSVTPLKRSKRSSTSTSRMDATERTSA